MLCSLAKVFIDPVLELDNGEVTDFGWQRLIEENGLPRSSVMHFESMKMTSYL